jgi:hypothetical protein
MAVAGEHSHALRGRPAGSTHHTNSNATEPGFKPDLCNSLRGRGTLFGGGAFVSMEEIPMSKETPKTDPRERSARGSLRQTDKPWKGNPEKEQKNDDAKPDL